MKKLMEYDKDSISDGLIKKLKKYVENPKFTPDDVAKVSKVSIFIVATFQVSVITLSDIKCRLFYIKAVYN